MNKQAAAVPVLPYSKIVGQRQLKQALEIAFIEPRISGVLVSGERGTGKSTTVRAFAQMVSGRLPVTLPINATEDRVVGGWDIGELLKSKPKWKRGLLEEAHGSMLYIDEVNLLDDHIINIILDVTASGILRVEQHSHTDGKQVRFTLVGTMNPEEGALRPQLLDRFGLMVNVQRLEELEDRRRVLETVLAAEDRGQQAAAIKATKAIHARLVKAQKLARGLEIAAPVLQACVDLARKFEADGHRGDYTLALAARALAANEGAKAVTKDHVAAVAPLALQHRSKMAGQRELRAWSKEQDAVVTETLQGAAA